MTTTTCPGLPTVTPCPCGCITTSNLSSPSTSLSTIIGMDTTALVSPGKTVIVIEVSTKSDANV